MKERLYVGVREGSRVTVSWMEGDMGGFLPYAIDLSGTKRIAFDWGDGSAGAWTLAFCILFDVLQDAIRVEALYHRFTDEVLACLPHERWVLKLSEVLVWIDRTEVIGEVFRF